MTSSLANHNYIESCQGLVKALALKTHRNLPAHVDLDDLIGYGQIGLAEAARDFDPKRGGQFTTFAFYRIRGAIYDGLAKMSWQRRSHARKIKFEQMANEALRLEHEDAAGGASASLESEANWLKSVSGRLAVIYFSTLTGEDDGPLELEDRREENPSHALMNGEIHGRLRKLIDELPDEAGQLIRATYFEGLSLTDAGRRLGFGKAWASRLHSRTLERLARSLRLAGAGD